jgi:outer membrane protein assembly factor BamB
VNRFTSSAPPPSPPRQLRDGASFLLPSVILIWLSTVGALLLARNIGVTILRSDEHPLAAVLLVLGIPWLFLAIVVMGLVARLGRRLLTGSRRARSAALVVLGVVAVWALSSGLTHARRWSMESNPRLTIVDAGNDYEASVTRESVELLIAGAFATLGFVLLLRASPRREQPRARMNEHRATIHGLLLAVTTATLISGVDLVGARQADAHVEALHDVVDHSVDWIFGSGRSLSRPVVSVGRVLVSDSDGLVFALDAATGREVWRTAPGLAEFSTAPIVDGLRVYVANCCVVTALDISTGRVEWRYSLKKERGIQNQLRGEMAAADGDVFLPTDDGIVALRGSRGEVIWRASEDAWVTRGAIDADGTVVVFAHQSRLAAYEPRTGRVRWSTRVPDWVRGRPMIAGRLVYVQSRTHVLRGYDARDGRLVWSRELGGPISERMAVDADEVYLGSGAQVIALDRRTGAILWRNAVRGDGVGDLVVGDQMLYVAHEAGIEALTPDGGSAGCVALAGRVTGADNGPYVIFGTRLFRLRHLEVSPALLRELEDAGLTNGAGCANVRYDRSAIRDARTIKPGPSR